MNKSFMTFIILLMSIHMIIAQNKSVLSALDFNYSIKPVPTEIGMDFFIELSFKWDSTLTIDLPKDYYGVKDYQQYFVDFEGKKGTKVTDNKYQKIITPNFEHRIHLNYRLSLSKKEMDHYSFSPKISTSNFHLTGSQILLSIGSLDLKNNYKIIFVDFPEGWNFYSSLSNTPRDMIFSASYNDLISSGFGGGNQPNTAFCYKRQTCLCICTRELST